jgi:ABC-2 type transport system permease protein
MPTNTRGHPQEPRLGQRQREPFDETAHRDVGAGLLPDRPGPAAAARSLLSPLGLAWRLQRGALAGWAVAVVVLGAAYGGVGNELEGLIGGSDRAAEFFEQLGGGDNLLDAYFSTVLGMIGLIATGYAVTALLRMRTEETGGALEPVLATAVSKPRWMLSHISVTALGTTALLLLAGLSAGLTYGLVTGGVSGSMMDLAGWALVQAPAALTFAGFVVAVYGLIPRAAVAVSWTAFAICLLLGQLGALLDLPETVRDLSPFTHLPRVPVENATTAPLLALLAVAAALTAIGIALVPPPRSSPVSHELRRHSAPTVADAAAAIADHAEVRELDITLRQGTLWPEQT